MSSTYQWWGLTHHVCLERFQHHLQERFAGEERGLVHLLLSQVVVVVHGLHEGTQEVHTGMADPVVLPAEGPNHLLPNYLPETGTRERGGRVRVTRT